MTSIRFLITATAEDLPVWSLVNILGIAVLGIFTTLVCTYLFTSYRFFLQLQGHWLSRNREPPSIPYWIPWIGNGLQFARHPHALYDYARSKCSDSMLVKVRLASNHAYIVSGSKNVHSIFRSAKNLSFDAEFFQILQRVYGLPKVDAALLCGGSPDESKRTVHRLDKLYAAHLASPRATSSLIGQFVRIYTEELETPGNDEWNNVNVNTYLRQAMSKAAISTLVGPSIFEKSPSFSEDYWQFDDGFKSLLYGMPMLLCRKETLARDRALCGVKAFVKGSRNGACWKAEQNSDADWEPRFGSRMVRELDEFLCEIGISADGRASMELSLIFAINSNSVPTATWILNEIIRNPMLHQQIHNEIQSALSTSPKETSNWPTLDLIKLQKLPHLMSLYSECLRFHLSAQLGRRIKQDMPFEGHMLKAGNAVIAPTWLAHRDNAVWSTPDHPSNRVWPERFLHIDAVKAGDFFPFGTGVASCPARNYAKQEILIAVALMLLRFEMEPLHFVNADGSVSDRDPKPLGGEGMGSGRPDRDLLVRLRRRRV